MMLVIGTVVSTLQAFRIKAANTIAEAQAENSRRSLVRLVEGNGLRHFDGGDFYKALPWFVEALKLDAGDAARETVHRRRIASVLQHSPSLVNVWHHPDGNASEVIFSPNGSQLYLRHRDGGKISVLDPLTGNLETPVSEGSDLRFIGLNHDGSLIAGAFEGEVVVWELPAFREVVRLPHAGAVRVSVFHPGNNRLLTAGDDGQVHLWWPENGESLGQARLGADEHEAPIACWQCHHVCLVGSTSRRVGTGANTNN